MPTSLAPPETVEWLKTAHRCDTCFPLADAVKLYGEVKGYDRGDVDWRERTVPPYPRTSEQRAIQVAPEQPELKPVETGVEFLAPAAEYPVEAIIKRNKNGKINTQSTVGKVVSVANEKGCELKVGGIWSARGAEEPYERNLWLQGAHHGLRFSVTGTTVIVNGSLVAKEELLRRLADIEDVNTKEEE